MSGRLNDRQKRFCEYYAQSGNATEAAKQAGYSAKTARQIGQRLLTNVDILAYLQQLQEPETERRIASILDTKRVLSDILFDETQKAADRIRAGDILIRSAGGYYRDIASDDGHIIGEYNGEDVVIYLPSIDTEEEHETDETGILPE